MGVSELADEGTKASGRRSPKVDPRLVPTQHPQGGYVGSLTDHQHTIGAQQRPLTRVPGFSAGLKALL